MIKISFIIVTYNSEILINDCLQSIYDYADIKTDEFEIIIIDNSDDSAHKKLLNITNQFSEVKVIHNPSNSGYGAGNNIGIRKSQGSIISIMNPDVRIQSPIMKAVLSKFNNMNLALLGYKQIGGLNLSFYPRPEFRKGLIDGFLLKKNNKNNNFKSKEDFLSGAFMFIDKNKFIEIGLFDEKIFMYNEESDICKRFIDKNYAIEFDANHSYLHLITERPFNVEAFKNEIISLDYYLIKNKIDRNRIYIKTLKELKRKKIIAMLIGKNNAVERFKKMITIVNDISTNKFK